MTALPDPLTAPDCDLQSFAFMPLHVARLRDSDLAGTEHPEACWYAVLLWAAAWHQVPAASLPDDELVLTRLCGLGRDVKTFRKFRSGAMRGFIKCSDGRLYHEVVAEVAVEAWQRKQEQSWKTECARLKKAAQRAGTEHVSPTFEEWLAAARPSRHRDTAQPSPGHGDNVPEKARSVPRDKGSKGQGQGQREEGREGARAGEREIRPVPTPPADIDDMRSLAAECARTAGTRHIDPTQVIRDIETVRGWTEAGADPPLILETIRGEILTAAKPIFSLRYFDQPVRTVIARREASANGSVPRQDHRNGSRDEVAERALARIAGRVGVSRGGADQSGNDLAAGS